MKNYIKFYTKFELLHMFQIPYHTRCFSLFYFFIGAVSGPKLKCVQTMYFLNIKSQMCCLLCIPKYKVWCKILLRDKNFFRLSKHKIWTNFHRTYYTYILVFIHFFLFFFTTPCLRHTEFIWKFQ